MNRELLTQAVRECVRSGKDIAFVPNGRNTKAALEILEQNYGLKPKYLIDNKNQIDDDNQLVYSISDLPENASDCCFLITAEYRHDCFPICAELQKRFPRSKKIQYRNYTCDQLEVLADSEKVHLDFLCVGFPKCLTSSLYTALLKNKNLYLGVMKETHFLEGDFSPVEHEKYKAMYPAAATQGKICGGVETQYAYDAHAVYNYYGDKLKILFMLRNPVDAMFSYFKMDCRILFSDRILGLYEKYGKPCLDMFEEWSKWLMPRFMYGTAIYNYLFYYPKTQLHLVICEELLRDTCKQMDNLQAFMGLSACRRIAYDSLPRINVGSSVSRDYLFAMANRHLWDVGESLVDNHDKVRWEVDILPSIYKETCTICDFSLTPELRNRLLDVFLPDIHCLENEFGLDLKGVWY